MIMQIWKNYWKRKIERRLAIFDKFTHDFGREVERRGLTEEQVMAELEETKQEVFREQYGRLR